VLIELSEMELASIPIANVVFIDFIFLISNTVG